MLQRLLAGLLVCESTGLGFADTARQKPGWLAEDRGQDESRGGQSEVQEKDSRLISVASGHLAAQLAP